MNIAFDIDDTLLKVIVLESVAGLAVKYKQVPDIDMFNLLHWYIKNGDNVFIWSAGGLDYTNSVMEKFFTPKDRVIALTKTENKLNGEFFIDICYDDQEVNFAKVNVRVKRENHYEE